jgi:hypothetical protein
MMATQPHGSKNAAKVCGAKTRRGTACRRAAMPNGKCYNHGGKSLRWMAHPNFKHGRYSKYSGISEQEKADRLRKRNKEKQWKAFDEAVKQFVRAKGREPTIIEQTSILRTILRET